MSKKNKPSKKKVLARQSTIKFLDDLMASINATNDIYTAFMEGDEPTDLFTFPLVFPSIEMMIDTQQTHLSFIEQMMVLINEEPIK